MLRSIASQIARSAYLLLEPIGLVWLALLILTFLLWRKRQRGFAAATAGLAAFILLIGGTDFSGVLLRSLERPYVGVKIEELPKCDAVVVLGGGFEPSRYEVAGLRLTPSADRIVMALELLRLGKAPVCIGGSSAIIAGEELIESEVVRQAIVERQMTSAEVIPLGRCSNTREEATRVRELAQARGWQRVLLVTSASHMRRASATFRAAGIEAVPAPCNFFAFIGDTPRFWRMRPPGFGGFVRCSTWLHEVVGWHSYDVRGWVE